MTVSVLDVTAEEILKRYKLSNTVAKEIVNAVYEILVSLMEEAHTQPGVIYRLPSGAGYFKAKLFKPITKVTPLKRCLCPERTKIIIRATPTLRVRVVKGEE